MRCTWADVAPGTCFELRNRKRWPDGRTGWTLTRHLLLSRDDAGADLETTVIGSLPTPHVMKARVPLSAWPEGAQIVDRGAEELEVPAGRFLCRRYGLTLGAVAVEVWMTDGLPVPVRSENLGGPVKVTTELVDKGPAAALRSEA